MPAIREKLWRGMMDLMVGGVQPGYRLRYASASGHQVDFRTLRCLEKNIAALAPAPRRACRWSIANGLRRCALQIHFLQFSGGEKCYRTSVRRPKGSVHQFGAGDNIRRQRT